MPDTTKPDARSSGGADQTRREAEEDPVALAEADTAEDKHTDADRGNGSDRYVAL